MVLFLMTDSLPFTECTTEVILDTQAYTTSFTVATAWQEALRENFSHMAASDRIAGVGRAQAVPCQRLNSPDICPAVKIVNHGLLKHLFLI